jgi:cob(I)alamin adenosyltransferase
MPPALLHGVSRVTWAATSTQILAPRNHDYTRVISVSRQAFSLTKTPFMSNRLTQIATRTGDNGTTGLGDNTRVSKNSLRVHAMGDVDELNSNLGVLLCEELPAEVRELLVEIQHQLFNLGGELSIPGFELLKPEAVAALDAALEQHNATLPRLAEFILPAGSRAASLAHVCRTVARRAERAVVSLGSAEALKDAPRQYLNRLSDLMFVLARVLNRMNGGDDVYWKSEKMAQAAAAE